MLRFYIELMIVFGLVILGLATVSYDILLPVALMIIVVMFIKQALKEECEHCKEKRKIKRWF